jgi:hypothetical protein
MHAFVYSWPSDNRCASCHQRCRRTDDGNFQQSSVANDCRSNNSIRIIQRHLIVAPIFIPPVIIGSRSFVILTGCFNRDAVIAAAELNICCHRRQQSLRITRPPVCICLSSASRIIFCTGRIRGFRQRRFHIPLAAAVVSGGFGCGRQWRQHVDVTVVKSAVRAVGAVVINRTRRSFDVVSTRVDERDSGTFSFPSAECVLVFVIHDNDNVNVVDFNVVDFNIDDFDNDIRVVHSITSLHTCNIHNILSIVIDNNFDDEYV